MSTKAMKSWEESLTRWLWRPKRVTALEYPPHGTPMVMSGKLTGTTSTDYFHFECPSCGPDGCPTGLYAELLGIRDDSRPSDGTFNPTSLDTFMARPKHPAMTLVLGLSCRECGLRDLVKLPMLERVDYAPAQTSRRRRHAEPRYQTRRDDVRRLEGRPYRVVWDRADGSDVALVPEACGTDEGGGMAARITLMLNEHDASRTGVWHGGGVYGA